MPRVRDGRDSVKTREAYLAAVVGLVRFDRRSPDQISDAEVQTYLLRLIQERKQATNGSISG
jgi:hypothetical protein